MPRPRLRCQAALQLQRIMRGKLARKKVIYLLKCAEIWVGGRHIMATFPVSNVHPVVHLYDGWIFSCVLDGKRVHTIDHLKNVVAKQKCFVLCGQVTLKQCKRFVALSFTHTHTHTHPPFSWRSSQRSVCEYSLGSEAGMHANELPLFASANLPRTARSLH